MDTKIKSKYAEEVAAIRRIRAANTAVPALTLAKGIRTGKFTDPQKEAVSHRTELSTYSVIRRYDAAIEAGKTPATAA